MVSSELIKLISIITVGIITIVVGGFYQRKLKLKKQKEIEMMNSAYSSGGSTKESSIIEEELSSEELNAKNYIEQYKNDYPRDSLKQGLIQMGVIGDNIETYLVKYFDN